jgi:hypothetical protein
MSNLSNMRPVCIGPWRKGTLAKPSKVRRSINVAVRSATTLAVKAMLCPQSDFTSIGRLQSRKRCMGSLIGFDQNRGGRRPNPRPFRHARYASSAQPQDKGQCLLPKSGDIRHGIF